MVDKDIKIEYNTHIKTSKGTKNMTIATASFKALDAIKLWKESGSTDGFGLYDMKRRIAEKDAAAATETEIDSDE
jgi:hypothetical protein